MNLAKSLLIFTVVLASAIIIGNWYDLHGNFVFVVALTAFSFAGYRYIFGQWERRRRERPVTNCRR